MAMRFMNGLNSIMNALHSPSSLKVPSVILRRWYCGAMAA